MYSHSPSSFRYLLIGCIETPIADVVTDRASKQKRLLQHNSDLTTQRTLRYIPHIMPVNQYCSLLHIIETCQQSSNRTFPGSGWPHNGESLTGLNMQIQSI